MTMVTVAVSVLLVSILVYIPQAYSFVFTLARKDGSPPLFSRRSSRMTLNAQGDGALSASSNNNNDKKPRLIVFDLDGCLWRPEMYELQWEGWGAGSPFQLIDSSSARSNSGTVVELLGDVSHVLQELHTDPMWNNVKVGISSRTDEPSWAKELLQMFKLPESQVSLEKVFSGPIEISYDSKTRHFERISSSTGVPMESILFFDNEYGNCKSVSKQGVSVCYCPDGVTRQVWEKAIECFPCAWGEVVGIDM